MRKVIVGVVFLFVLGFVFNVGVEARMGWSSHRSGRMENRGSGSTGAYFSGKMLLRRYADQMQLTESQEDEIAEIQRAHELQIIDLQAEINKEQVAQRELLAEDEVNRTIVRRKMEEIAKKRAAVQFNRLELRLDIKELLTDRQQDKLDELRSERMKQMRSRSRENRSGRDGRKDDSSTRQRRGR